MNPIIGKRLNDLQELEIWAARHSDSLNNVHNFNYEIRHIDGWSKIDYRYYSNEKEWLLDYNESGWEQKIKEIRSFFF